MFNSIFQDRNNQLRKQEEQDKKLKEMYKTCPTVIVNYLLFSREKNREMTKEYESVPFYSIPGVISTHLEYHDEHNKKLDTILKDSANPCYELSAMLFEEIHKKKKSV
jgi:hypothetical protein